MPTSPRPRPLVYRPVPRPPPLITNLEKRARLLAMTPPASHTRLTFAAANRIFTAPPNTPPSSLFSVHWNACCAPGVRFLHNSDPHITLAFISGVCLNNGSPSALGGSSVVYSVYNWTKPHVLPLPMDGEIHTNERAELQALLEVLTMRKWDGEGCHRLVVATDSEFLVMGVTEWVAKWQKNGWKTAGGKDVKNRDLWDQVLEGLEACSKDKRGLLVQFWKIPREWNEATAYARMAAEAPVKGRRTCVGRSVVLERGTSLCQPGLPVMFGWDGLFGKDAALAEGFFNGSIKIADNPSPEWRKRAREWDGVSPFPGSDSESENGEPGEEFSDAFSDEEEVSVSV
ncbi:ribonuclease H-like protein [Ascobolus immersus RN42]|uniref:ribonuclease H n=1 Tax=Ascobolus immersus RN42 TaxID=1160509 RepID=A0A3N4IB61_ASCIM|nr:ribonuclease H-like protein [Ascobolus immersus RN42]